MKSFRFIVVVLFLFQLQVSAQVNERPVGTCCTHIDWPYIKSGFVDTKDIFISPVSWKGNDWLKFGGVAAIGSILYWQDGNIQKWSQTLRNKPTDQIVKYAIEPWGRGIYLAPVYAGIFTYGAIKDDDYSRQVALVGTKAFLITGAYTYVSKLIFQRHRPYQDEPPNPRKWEFFVHGKTDYNGFPSGHSSEAFAAAAILASAYPDKKGVVISSYTIASLVALSRIYDNKHWASDVFIGSAFGFFIGRFVWKQSVSK